MKIGDDYKDSLLQLIELKFGEKVEVSRDVLAEMFPDPDFGSLACWLMAMSGRDIPSGQEKIDRFCKENNLTYWKEYTGGIDRHFFIKPRLFTV